MGPRRTPPRASNEPEEDGLYSEMKLQQRVVAYGLLLLGVLLGVAFSKFGYFVGIAGFLFVPDIQEMLSDQLNVDATYIRNIFGVIGIVLIALSSLMPSVRINNERQKVADLEKDVKELRKKFEKELAESNSYKEALKDARKEQEKYQKQYVELKEKQETEKNKQIEDLKLENESLKNDVSELESKLKTLREEKESISSQLLQAQNKVKMLEKKLAEQEK